MENTILKRTKILYDDNHFVNVMLVHSEGNVKRRYVPVTQVDDRIVCCGWGTGIISEAYEIYRSLIADIFSMTFDELMKEFGGHEVIEELYEEALDALGLSKEIFGHKKPSELFDTMQDVSHVELVRR